MKLKTVVFCAIIIILTVALYGCSEATSLSFAESRIVIGVGEEITPQINIFPKNSEYTLSVSNSTIAQVTDKTVKGLKTGITDLIVTSGNKTAKATLIVSDVTTPGDVVSPEKTPYYVTFRIVNPSDVGLENNLLETQVYYENETVYRSLPAYTGFTVSGWYTDPQCTIQFSESQNPVKGNLDLYCRAYMAENSFLIDNDGLLTGLVFKNLPHDSLTLPENINGKEVKGIAANAFSNDTLVKEVFIPACYESIGDFAFAGCTSLVKVEIEENSRLLSIGKFAFSVTGEEESDGTEDEDDEDENTDETPSLVSGENPCKNLKEINLPDSVGSIGAFAFAYCSSLKLNGIPSALTKIEYGAFTETLITDANFESVTEIQAFAFLNCTDLLTVRNTQNVTSCGVDAFTGTALYKGQINQSPYIVYADTILFTCNTGYGKLLGGKLTLPERVTLIADGAFNGENQSELTVYFPKAGVKIGDGAFITGGKGVCLVTNDEITCNSYKDEAVFNDNAAYADLFCVKITIRVDEDENGVNFGEHTLLKFSATDYRYDKFTVINSTSSPEKLKSPKIISLSALPYGEYITRINTRAVNLGEYGGNLETLILPRRLNSVAVLSVINCGLLTKIDMTACTTVPDIVINSFQFSSLGDKTNPRTETKIYVKAADLEAYQTKWKDKGLASQRLTSE